MSASQRTFHGRGFACPSLSVLRSTRIQRRRWVSWRSVGGNASAAMRTNTIEVWTAAPDSQRSLPKSLTAFDTAKTVGIPLGGKTWLVHLKGSQFWKPMDKWQTTLRVEEIRRESYRSEKRIGTTRRTPPTACQKSRSWYSSLFPHYQARSSISQLPPGNIASSPADNQAVSARNCASHPHISDFSYRNTSILHRRAIVQFTAQAALLMTRPSAVFRSRRKSCLSL